jgi:hypothetical protein
VTVRIKGRTVEDAFILPRHAVYPGDVVYTALEGRLKFKSVSVLRSFRENLVVAGGIDSGDAVIITPLPAATDGMKIRVEENPAPLIGPAAK